jgi:hypothetical protein
MAAYNPRRHLYQLTFTGDPTLHTAFPSAQEFPILDEVFLLKYIESSNLGSPTGRTCEKNGEIPSGKKCDNQRIQTNQSIVLE